MMRNIDSRLKEIGYYFTSIILCTCILVYIFCLWEADIRIPFLYNGDSLLMGAFIKGIIDNGWIYYNPYIGSPSGLLTYDYPINFFLDFVIIKYLSILFPSWAITLNFYYLLTYPLTVITTLYVFRKIDISPIPAIFGSLIFTFIPYHILRGEAHLTLSSYYLIPLIILVIFWVFEDNFLFSLHPSSLKNLFLDKKTLFSILICILISLSFIYYPLFSCFFLLIAGICTTISRRKYSPLINSGILIAIIIFCIFACNLPSLLYQNDYGKNSVVGFRSPSESEQYGLKIIQLLLPVSGHRIDLFSHISSYYAVTAPLINENSWASLGIIGAVGFLILILWMFYCMFNKNPIRENHLYSKITQLSTLNLSAIILATIGGFSSIIAYLLSPQIRCYNRICIFIAFFCIAVIVLIMDFSLKRKTNSKIFSCLIVFGIIGLLCFGIFDQTPRNMVPDYSANKENYQQDDLFIKKIETNYPNDTMIFQFPYIPFPENPPVNNMTDYDHFKGYLHSEKIHWSYGAIRGRDEDLWQKEITSNPINETIKTIFLRGFTGIYVDSYGYPDNGAEFLSSLNSTLNTTPIVSHNGRYFFFDLSAYGSMLKTQLNTTVFETEQNKILNSLKLSWMDGFWSAEDSHRWCSSLGSLIIVNPQNKKRKIIMNMTFVTGYPEKSHLIIESPGFSDNLIINNSGYAYKKEMIIPPGATRIKFSTDAKRVYAVNDPRILMFHLDNFQFIEQEL